MTSVGVPAGTGRSTLALSETVRVWALTVRVYSLRNTSLRSREEGEMLSGAASLLPTRCSETPPHPRESPLSSTSVLKYGASE